MKKYSILAIVLALTLVSFASAESDLRSSTDRFLSNLSDTWDSFLDMADDAGKSVSGWAEESGVTDWIDEKVGDISAWAKENGLTEWAQNSLDELSALLDESGLSEWAAEKAQDLRAFVEENRPAVEAWLIEAGGEVREAWDILMDAGRYTTEELQAAYETVAEALAEAGK